MPFLKCSYGGLPLLVSSIDTDRGRDIATYSPANGDTHSLGDRGKRLVRVQCEILFVQQPGLADYLDRYREFMSLVDSPDSQVFTHPLDGSYVARAEAASVSSSSDSSSVRVQCTFLRDDVATPVQGVAAGVDATAGVEAVEVAAAEAEAELAALTDLGESAAVATATATPAACVEAVTAWHQAEDLDSQQVFLDVGELAGRIDRAIETLGLANDLTRWQAYQQFVLLRYQVVRAAEAFTSETESVFELFVETARPVLAICAEVYPAREAVQRAAQVVKLNGLRTPGRVPAGTSLKMPRAA